MKKRLIRIIVSAVLFVLGLVVAPVLSVTWPRIVIFVAAYLLVGTEILIKAAKASGGVKSSMSFPYGYRNAWCHGVAGVC